ncbi:MULTISPECIES: ferredoxin [unclassified Geodermatophilus]|uniref:ferredoxin n=1 Tax=unclassified Geodermatophilus TaxID=2637632 RepID=UPI003EEF8297
MRVVLDATRCEAYGACADHCPSLFALDEWGYASVIGDGSVPAGEEQNVRAAAHACPEKAIAVLD